MIYGIPTNSAIRLGSLEMVLDFMATKDKQEKEEIKQEESYEYLEDALNKSNKSNKTELTKEMLINKFSLVDSKLTISVDKVIDNDTDIIEESDDFDFDSIDFDNKQNAKIEIPNNIDDDQLIETLVIGELLNEQDNDSLIAEDKDMDDFEFDDIDIDEDTDNDFELDDDIDGLDFDDSESDEGDDEDFSGFVFEDDLDDTDDEPIDNSTNINQKDNKSNISDLNNNRDNDSEFSFEDDDLDIFEDEPDDEDSDTDFDIDLSDIDLGDDLEDTKVLEVDKSKQEDKKQNTVTEVKNIEDKLVTNNNKENNPNKILDDLDTDEDLDLPVKTGVDNKPQGKVNKTSNSTPTINGNNNFIDKRLNDYVNNALKNKDTNTEELGSKYDKYSVMEVEALYKEVKLYMINRGVKTKALDINELNDTFGPDNIKKLITKQYLIKTKKGVTVGL